MPKLVKQQVLDEMQKGMILLEFKFFESEFEKLKSGNTIPLDNRSLGEVGLALLEQKFFQADI